jgi:hypothetical protein
VALDHTGGALTDVVSPSRLNATRALLNYIVAALIVALAAAASRGNGVARFRWQEVTA